MLLWIPFERTFISRFILDHIVDQLPRLVWCQLAVIFNAFKSLFGHPCAHQYSCKISWYLRGYTSFLLSARNKFTLAFENCKFPKYLIAYVFENKCFLLQIRKIMSRMKCFDFYITLTHGLLYSKHTK